MKKITIPIPNNSYKVFIGNGIIKNVLAEAERQNLYRNIFMVIDSKVYSLYKNEIDRLFKSYKGKLASIKIDAKESLKSFYSP